jgi:alanine racemase
MLTILSSWVEISKGAFDHNIRTYRSIIGPDKKLSIIIKSNAYGHDTVTTARLCQEHLYVDWICSNSLSEALEIRNAGITKPILVICNIDDHPALAIVNNIDLIGYSLDQIKKLNEIGNQKNQPIYIHLKVNTGMGRLGFLPEELFSALDQIVQLPYIRLRGLFSHFAESSSADLTYTHYQAECFKKIVQKLKQMKIEIPLRHLANSAATPLISLEEANMVRLGAGAFGLYPSHANTILTKNQHPSFFLKPILTWKTHIVHIKNVPANIFIGYNRSYKTNRNTTIGFLPIGYYEGLDIQLSNKGVVLLSRQQKYVPIIGKICMNMTMIDLTGIDTVAQDDEVTLIANKSQINPEAIQHLTNIANPREITSRIVSSIPRFIVS